MKYRNKAKYSVALAVAAIIACQPVSALAVTFADMNDVPWPGAETSINKAASLGLVVGETINGKSYFKPKDPVSLTQSCQFAYKVLLETGKATADSSITKKWSTVMATYNIQDWAQPAVSYCLEEGIISISDLSGFVKNGINISATREQAAEILGRALTVGNPAYEANATTTKFVDNSSISADAKPFIALLNEVGIVNGDDLGKFNPKNTLNRTETAVMVTNLYEELKSAPSVAPSVPTTSTTSGTVADLTNFYVNFENSAAYYLYSSSGITATLNGSSTSVSELVTLFKDGAAMTASLTLDGNNRITKLAVTADEDTADDDKDDEKDTEGTLTKVKYDEEDGDGSITINKSSTYKIDDVEDVDVEIDDDEMDFEDLYDLFEECEDNDEEIEVEITLNSKGDVRKIIGEVVDADDEDGDTVKGEVKSMSYDEDEEEGSIKIGSKKYEVEDTDDVSVKVDGKTKDFEYLYDLYEDDEYLYVTLTLDDDDYVTKIVASTEEEEEDEEAEGEVEDVTWKESKETGTIKVDGDTYDCSDTDDVEISITDGKSDIEDWEGLYNAYKDKKVMEVTVTIEDDEVVEIEGKVTEAKGYLSGQSSSYLKLEGKNSGTEVKYEFDDDNADDIDVDIDGSNMSKIETMEDFIEWLDDADYDDEEFTLILKLDKNGYITEVTGERD